MSALAHSQLPGEACSLGNMSGVSNAIQSLDAIKRLSWSLQKCECD